MSENLIRRKSKVSLGRFVRQGLAGPKPRPKGVGDGEQVNIPAPPACVITDGGTQKDRPASEWLCLFKPVGGGSVKRIPSHTLKGDEDSNPRVRGTG